MDSKKKVCSLMAFSSMRGSRVMLGNTVPSVTLNPGELAFIASVKGTVKGPGAP